MLKKLFQNKKIICTHSGRFHADDVFAVATLDLYFKGNIKVIRSREIKDIENADIVVDNGKDYDVDKNIFDHHQPRGAGKRDSGIEYAGFGLIWKHFGMELCKQDKDLWQEIDDTFVAQIDAGDTGLTDFYNAELDQTAYVPNKIIAAFMPTPEENVGDVDKNFLKCVSVAKEILKRLLITKKFKLKSKKIILNIYEKTEDKRIIILDSWYPWPDILIEKEEPIFVIHPDSSSTNYCIQAVPLEKEGYAVRKKFPESWAGLSGADLEKVSGIEGSVFCHNARFLAVAKDLDSAKKIAEKSLVEKV